MIKLSGVMVLLAFHLLGEAIAALLGLPIPGAVIGLLLLFSALIVCGGVGKPLEQASGLLIGLLPLLLIVPSAGVFFLGDSFADQWPAFAGAVVAGTVLTLVICALTMKFLSGGKHG